MWATAPILMSLATFAAYSFLYGDLTPATAFTALSLFNVLRFPLTMFPNTITNSVEANVSVTRLERFLCLPEIQGARARSLEMPGVFSRILGWYGGYHHEKVHKFRGIFSDTPSTDLAWC